MIFYLLLQSPNAHNYWGCPVKARHVEFIPELLNAWQGSRYLSQHLFPPRLFISRNLDQKLYNQDPSQAPY